MRTRNDKVLCAFKVLQGGLPIEELFGIVVGHLYYFLADLYPLQSGRRLLVTPAFLHRLFPSRYGTPAHLRRGGGDDEDDNRAHRWGGAGQPLGGR